MTTKLWMGTLIGLVFPTLALSQAPSNEARSDAQKALGLSSRTVASPSKEMYEDIEIMRRILNRKMGLWPGLVSLNGKCTLCHTTLGSQMSSSQGIPSNAMVGADFGSRLATDQAGAGTSLGVALNDVNQDGWLDVFLAKGLQGYDAAHAFLAAPTNTEGVYLHGQGAVYTLTLPPLPRSRSPGRVELSLKPINDWERARQSLHGNEPQPKQSDTVKESNETGIFSALEKSGYLGITEAVLKILADNGQHFSQLPADEKITVAITFREPSAQTRNQSQLGNQMSNPLAAWGNQPETPTTWEADTNRPLNVQPPGAPTAGIGFSGGAGLSGGPAGASSTAAAPSQTPASVRDFELLGDMHLKQGRAQEAIQAFQRALNLSPPPKHAATLYRKIAQAYLMKEDDAAAKKSLEMAADNLKMAGEAAKNTAASAPGGPGKGNHASSLPAKLIISAPKKLLDQVASGKVSYADFRRQATIDLFGSASNPAAPAKH
jgi:tetratricopeptide (TPR) repeat protein